MRDLTTGSISTIQPVMTDDDTTGRIGERDADFALADLEYTLPEGMIAQRPLPRRDDSRLLVLDRTTEELRDGCIGDLPELLRPGDLLVLNDTRVLPARLIGRRRTGGRVRGLFVGEDKPGEWRVMFEGSRRLRVGESLTLTGGEAEEVTLHLLESLPRGHWRARVDAEESAEQILSRVGRTPLPPYIGRKDTDPAIDREDRSRYQTVYASRAGAIAAPTAGLHLTADLLDKIHTRGVETTCVTLHVGVGTFQPIEVDDVSRHVMHAEWYEVTPETATAVRQCRERNGRVVAVGTTSVRVLETAAADRDYPRTVRPSSGMTELFIHPPYRFRMVDALLTNFHLPGSTLLALIMALAGVESIRRAYAHAIEQSYRFYSYGDAMLIV